MLGSVALFVAAQDEAEFAGMLAHTMAYVVEHHSRPRGGPSHLLSTGLPLGRLFWGPDGARRAITASIL